jgi:hypothetical protein
MRKVIICLLTLLIAFAVITNLYSQGKKAKKESAKKTDVEAADYLKDTGTYLDRFENSKRGRSLIEENLHKIRVLEIIVSNFGGDKKSALQELKDEYVLGKKLYYQNVYNRSVNILLKNKKKINELFKQFSLQYKKKTSQILEQCASQLTEFEINEISLEPGAEFSESNKKIISNAHRLKIAYQQERLGNNMLFYNRHYEAIMHYRLAKTFGIAILADLAPGKDGSDKIKSEYKVDLIDSKNKMALKKSGTK